MVDSFKLFNVLKSFSSMSCLAIDSETVSKRRPYFFAFSCSLLLYLSATLSER